MKIIGITAEYNPFHNGHRYHIEQTKKHFGDCAVIAVMSGSFVQRGEPAFYSKWVRTQAALRCGADLVIELPVPWAIARAETFACGAVNILKNTGCTDYISFGSECGDAELLNQAAYAILDDATSKKTVENLSSGITFASAREQAVQSLYGEKISSLLTVPNNILAIEYCKAIIKENAGILPFTVKRKGAEHDSRIHQENFASASFIRKNGDIQKFTPNEARDIFLKAPHTNIKHIERAVLSKLRTMDKAQTALLPDISEGIENRIYSASRSAESLEQLYALIKTKRYTLARIRRIIMSAFIGLTDADSKGEVPYIRVLGFNKKGADILNIMKRTAQKPLCTRASHLLEHGGSCFKAEQRATDLAALCYDTPLPCSQDLTNSVIALKN